MTRLTLLLCLQPGGSLKEQPMDDDKLTLDLLLDSLPKQDREIIVLWYIEGYNLEEISKILRRKAKPKMRPLLTPRHIGARLHQIIKKLRENAGVCEKVGLERT